MTKRELAQKIEARNRLLQVYNELAANPAASASLSAGGGSQSYTNRDLSKIRAEIDALDREIAAVKSALLGAGVLNIEYPRWC